MLSFTFNNKNSFSDFGILVEKRPELPSPKRRVSYVDIPGRHSGLRYDEKTFEDITIAVECSFKGDPYKRIDDIKKWLIGSGEQDLIFSYQPDKRYVAQVVNSIDFSIALKIVSKFIIIFNCRPFKYEVENAPVTIDTGDGVSLVNAGSVESRPIIKVFYTEEGSFKINDYELLLSKINAPYVILDCDLEEAYFLEEGLPANANNYISGEYPVLSTGINTITFTGGITKLEITPNWRWL